MRPGTYPLTCLLLLAAALLAGACGGGSGSKSASQSLADVPTATLPNSTPEPLIVGTAVAPAEGGTYTVKDGDSLSAIADRYSTTVAAIVQANNISDPRSLSVGQVLTIPGGTPSGGQVLGATEQPPATSTPAPAATPTTNGNVYTVKAGDYPEKIADQFGITTDELIAANNIVDPTGLYIGQELIIPTPAPTPAQ